MSRKILNGLDMASTPIDNLPDAVSAQQPVTLTQLNAAIEGRKWKDPCRVASTANLTLSGTQTVDSVALAVGDRVLVKNQSTASANGIYLVASGAWTRTIDANIAAEVLNMATAIVEGGQAGTEWLMNTPAPITLGSTNLTFIQVGSSSSYTAGTGISIVSGVISVDATVVGLTATANIGNGAATSIAVTHGLNSAKAQATVVEISTKAEVFPDVVYTDNNTVTVTFAVAPSTNQYQVRIVG